MLISSHDVPTFHQDGVTAIGLASPSRGASELSVWHLSLVAHETSPVHSLSREEVFVALAGSALATIAGTTHELAAGDCLVVPVDAPFTLVAGDDGLDAICAMGAGGQATILPDGPTITPPWAA
jgi:mannose-6-phosphate isomerase-like protein (cupin superfamily)